MFQPQDQHGRDGCDEQRHKRLSQKSEDRSQPAKRRDHPCHGIQNDQYQRNQDDAYDGPEIRKLGFIKVFLLCHMLRNGNHIFISADGSPYRACYDHGADPAEDSYQDHPAQFYLQHGRYQHRPRCGRDERMPYRKPGQKRDRVKQGRPVCPLCK